MTRILVIEDETSIRQNIVEMLEMEGFEVAGAANGREGLRMVLQFRPDLIICDITMPELDGYGVLLALRQRRDTATIPFMFLTARADREHMRYGMELGADDYLTKPFTFEELRAAVRTRLKRHAMVKHMAEQELIQARQSLIRMVSHELRTPLISVNMVTDIISRQLEQLSASQLRELIDTLERGAHRLSRLVEQSVFIVQLETSALSRDTVLEHGVPARMSDILIAAADLARRFAYRHPDVRLRIDERDSEVVVICDIRALRHALAELITNALSFSPDGSEVILAQWCADGAVWISLVDQGPGIPQELIKHALQDFHQVDRGRQEQQGIGLGLPLARRIIKAHGGTFELNSVVNRGTQITLSVPIAPVGTEC
ncbi:MAG: response regulator [Anaerolineae bacterium]|nr:response regulator [Anaerolineae bacterium]